jgi:hypothetical protein
MGAAAGTCLVIDLVERNLLPSIPTLAAFEESGLRRSHLEPSRSGVAVVARGDIGVEPACELVEELIRHWPATVIRASEGTATQFGRPFAVRPFLLEMEGGDGRGRVVWQRLSFGQRPPGPSLPPIGRGRTRQMLQGTVSPRWRWVKAWTPVWGLM